MLGDDDIEVCLNSNKQWKRQDDNTDNKKKKEHKDILYQTEVTV